MKKKGRRIQNVSEKLLPTLIYEKDANGTKEAERKTTDNLTKFERKSYVN